MAEQQDNMDNHNQNNCTLFTGHGLNPLTIDLILENIFRHCDKKGLNQVRLVSRHWYRVSLSAWLRRGPHIILHTQHSTDRTSMHGSQLKSLEKFLQERAPPTSTTPSDTSIINGLAKYPSFELHSPKSSEQLFLLTTFWSHCGEWITTLKLRDFVFPNLQLLRDVMFSRFTPNLERLDVRITPGEGLLANETVVSSVEGAGGEGKRGKLKALRVAIWVKRDLEAEGEFLFPIEWKTIFNYYPNLEELNLVPGSGLTFELESILTAIKEIRKIDKTSMALKSLSWFDDHQNRRYHFHESNIEIPPTLPQLLKDVQLDDLHSLGICFLRGAPERAVHETLEIVGKSLRSLALYKLDALKVPPFAGMSHLESLTLSGSPFLDMTFLKHVPPSLRTLKLFPGAEIQYMGKSIVAATKQKDMEGVVAPSIGHFTCCYIESWTTRDIRRLSGWMPKLTELELRLTNAPFREVGTCWPDLEHVRIFGEGVGDKGIIVGEEADDDDGDDGNDTGEGGEVRVLRNGNKVYTTPPPPVPPCVIPFQKLKSFVIDNPPGWWLISGQRITNESVLHGFLKWPRLETLVLKTNGLVDTETKAVLEEKFPFATVKILDKRRCGFRR